jgi:hypothetical protein
MGRRVDEASAVALMEFGAEVVLYAVSFLLKGVFVFFRGDGFSVAAALEPELAESRAGS